MAAAKVLAPDQGDKFWLVGDHPTIKLEAAQTGGAFDLAINWVAPGGGPPPHLHRNEDEMFYVLEGSATFMQDGTTLAGGPGSAIYLKKDIPHTFRSVGAVPLRMVIVTAPSGFADFVRECGEPIQQIPSTQAITPAAIDNLLRVAPRHGIEVRLDLPNPLLDWPVNGTRPTTAGRPYWVLGHLVTIKLGSAETGGKFSVAEVASPPGSLVPRHWHHEMDEFFCVMEGEYEFEIAGAISRAGAGAVIHVPPGIMHGFRSTGRSTARMADFHTPGGFERFFEVCGTPCNDPASPPPPVTIDMPELKKLFTRHGMELA